MREKVWRISACIAIACILISIICGVVAWYMDGFVRELIYSIGSVAILIGLGSVGMFFICLILILIKNE